MKYKNIIQAHICCLFVNKSLSESVQQTLSPDYTSCEYNDIEALTNTSIPTNASTIVLCEHELIADDEAGKLKQIRSVIPNASLLVIGPAVPVLEQINVLKNGARGYFNQSLLSDKLSEALQLILHGEVWVERQVISGLIDELTQIPALTPEQQTALDSLSPKELEVAKLVSHGSTNKMIAKTMNITERTVKAHLTTIFSKMNLPDRLSLAIFFRDLR
jgi:DNA-binding NarL/FixJ family response regulator